MAHATESSQRKSRGLARVFYGGLCVNVPTCLLHRSNKNEALAKFLLRKKQQGELTAELAQKVLLLPNLREAVASGSGRSGAPNVSRHVSTQSRGRRMCRVCAQGVRGQGPTTGHRTRQI
jgi:hypothetical protein